MEQNDEILPLISVIVPVYNVQKYLKKCVESIINQTYNNLEIILVDDGSTDESGDICDDFSKMDKRIVVVHKKNGGVSSARNTGLDIATGKYIGFVDSDDYIDKGMYAYLYELIRKEGADISHCGGYTDYGNGKIVKFTNVDRYVVLDKETALDWISDFSKYGIGVWDKLHRRELFENIRFPLGKLGEDFVVSYKTVLESNKIVHSTKEFYYYRQTPNSYTHSKKINFDNMNFSKEYMNMIIKDFPSISDNAIKKYVFTSLQVYNQIMLKDRSLLKKNYNVVKEIKKYSTMIDKKTLPKMKKIQLQLFLICRPVYNLTLKMMKNRGV